jgi:hypothetical protein
MSRTSDNLIDVTWGLKPGLAAMGRPLMRPVIGGPKCQGHIGGRMSRDGVLAVTRREFGSGVFGAVIF